MKFAELKPLRLVPSSNSATFPQPDRDKVFSYFYVLQFVCRKASCRFCIAGCILILVLFFAGCSKKSVLSRSLAGDFEVRVLLLRNAAKINLQAASRCRIFCTDPCSQSFLPAIGETIVTYADGCISIGEKRFCCSQIEIIPEQSVFSLNGSAYRGKLVLKVNAERTIDCLNVVGLEDYTAGVVGAEMPAYWEPAALQAQAICSRSYLLYIKRNFGKDRNWDVTATQANQVYAGISGETQSVRRAVNKTKGEVLLYRQDDGLMEILPAYFCSSCGGFTEGSQAVFGGVFLEPLKGVGCPYCRLAAKKFFWQDLAIDKSEISDKLIKRYPVLENLEKIVEILPSKQSTFQTKMAGDLTTLTRLTFLKLVGSNGQSSFLKAEDFRLTIDPSGATFRSTVCKIIDTNDILLVTEGRGYGHGCGLCQCGAQAMARFYKKNASQILSYYFPNSRIGYVY